MFYNFHCGDSLEVLKTFESESVHCCVTSPPYWGVRDYENDKQIGTEFLPKDYIESMVKVFNELKRVLKKDGTLWLNIGDCYSTTKKGGGGKGKTSRLRVKRDENYNESQDSRGNIRYNIKKYDLKKIGIPEKNIMGIPWRIAFALQENGWNLRQDIIWNKTNSKPESAKDRFTKSHEYIFLLTKNSNYFFDGERVREEGKKFATTKNKRTVWSLVTNNIKFEHKAVMPLELADICIKAGTSEKGCCSKCGSQIKRIVDEKLIPIELILNYSKSKEWYENNKRETIGWKQTCNCENIKYVPCTVIDPFCGSGTTIVSALKNNCNGIGIDLNPEYISIAEQRVKNSGENQ